MKLIDNLRAVARNFTRTKPVTSGSLRASSTNPDSVEQQNQWRRLGASSSRNLAGYQHINMVRQCVKSATVDPIARAHVRLVRAITVGAQELGIEVRCQDVEARKTLQDRVDTGWNHPANDLGASLGELMDGLTTTGSLALTLTTDADADGKGSMLTTIGYLDPESFADPGVLCDPGNARDPIAVLRGGFFASQGDIIAHPIIRNDDTVHVVFRDPASGRPLPLGATVEIPRRTTFGGPLRVVVGEPCMYLGINRVAPNQTLGISDLYTSLDLMGLLDELAFKSVERSVNLGAYSLHVKFPRGTDPKDVEARMNTIRADLESGMGRAVGTTDDVVITTIAAQLQAGEWATLEKMARTIALIGLGPWPAHMFSDGGATNVATAAEQGSPVANFLLDRQNAFSKFIIRIATYMLRRYPEARRLLDANPDAHLHISLPVIVAKDTTRESNVLQVETAVLIQAVENGLLKREAAQREARDLMNRYGMRITPEDVPDVATWEANRAAGIDLPITRVPPLPMSGAVPSEVTPSEGTPKAGAGA